MIFVLSSFIRLSEPISRGTVTGQRNSTTRLRVSCPTSRTSEHSSAGARGGDVRMFGCLPLDEPPRRRSAFYRGRSCHLRTRLGAPVCGLGAKILSTTKPRSSGGSNVDCLHAHHDAL